VTEPRPGHPRTRWRSPHRPGLPGPVPGAVRRGMAPTRTAEVTTRGRCPRAPAGARGALDRPAFPLPGLPPALRFAHCLGRWAPSAGQLPLKPAREAAGGDNGGVNGMRQHVVASMGDVQVAEVGSAAGVPQPQAAAPSAIPRSPSRGSAALTGERRGRAEAASWCCAGAARERPDRLCLPIFERFPSTTYTGSCIAIKDPSTTVLQPCRRLGIRSTQFHRSGYRDPSAAHHDRAAAHGDPVSATSRRKVNCAGEVTHGGSLATLPKSRATRIRYAAH
jgi:hypothetical protein